MDFTECFCWWSNFKISTLYELIQEWTSSKEIPRFVIVKIYWKLINENESFEPCLALIDIATFTQFFRLQVLSVGGQIFESLVTRRRRRRRRKIYYIENKTLYAQKEKYEGRRRKSLFGPLHKQTPIDNEFKNNRTSNRTDSRLMQKGLSDVFILFWLLNWKNIFRRIFCGLGQIKNVHCRGR